MSREIPLKPPAARRARLSVGREPLKRPASLPADPRVSLPSTAGRTSPPGVRVWAATLVFGALLLSSLAVMAQAPPQVIDPTTGQWVGPAWKEIRYDCVTGDHYIKEGDSGSNDCTGMNMPNDACYQPDVISDPQSSELIRCDEWVRDFYERPFSPGSDFSPDVDLIYAMITDDDEWYYANIQMYGLNGGKLDAAYSLELDIDPEVDPDNCGPAGRDDTDTSGTEWDDSPCPGDDPLFPDGVSCVDWFLRSTSPTSNILDIVGFNNWGQSGVIGFYDLDEDLGGIHCGRNDEDGGDAIGYPAVPWSGSGAEWLVADQGSGENGGEWGDGLWAMMPSDCQGLATDAGFTTDELLGVQDAGSISFTDTCVLLAVRKDMIASYLTKPRTPRTSNPSLPADFEFTWRAWANKGDQDNQNVQPHDKYSHEEGGDSYVDEAFYPMSSIKEMDSTARLGALAYFGPQEACPVESAEAELQAFGQFQTFTAAVVPFAQTESRDSIFLTSFLPVEGESRWPVNVDHFIQPLPVKLEDVDGDGLDEFVPDRSVTCADAQDEGCLAWDAGTAILAQSPNAVEVGTDRMIGPGTGERRVLYTQGPSFSPEGSFGIPRGFRELDYPFPSDAVAIDLAQGFGLSFNPSDSTELAQAKSKSEEIIRQTLAERSVIDPADSTQSIVFVAGDNFHGTPTQHGGPVNFLYLANDLHSNGAACNDSTSPNPGYRCFFERHRRRRKVLLVPSNDGQVHAFDAGRFQGSVVSGRVEGEFDRGSGHELFAHISRPMLRHTSEMTLVDHDFGVDAQPVVDDFFIDPRHGGLPTTSEREWRTVAIGGYREGSRGYYALDVTRPDHLDEVTVTNLAGADDIAYLPDDGGDYVPTCTSNYSSAECGPVPYPAMLWEFQDSCGGGPCDEDANSVRDLGPSWSKVNTGRIRIDVGGTVETRYVAIFGGGYDPDFPLTAGNWLYMVDVETGRAIYKRQLDGPAPAEPAAIDADQDTFIDTLYQATVAGTVYKVDLSQPALFDSDTGRIATTEWTPFQVFSTTRPIFVAPTVVAVSSLGQFALGFGTGDLEAILENDASEGRFYMVLDTGFTASTAGLPITEADLEAITLAQAPLSADLLTNPSAGNHPGWTLQLETDEKLVSDPQAISGLLTFTTFSVVSGTDADGCPTAEGTGRIYTLLATNANPLNGTDRFMEVEGFASDPFVVPSGVSQQTQDESVVDPFDTAEMQTIRQNLMGLFPANCRFGNFSLRVAVNVSSGEQVPVADIPQCVVEKNWKDF